ncbi:MAG: hypothetical protein ACI8ZM_001291 [Crocinitomix sp.]|jgi:hypothetical protein
MNHINKIRAEIKTFFDPKGLEKESEESFESPNGKYRLETSNYWQDKEDVNWDVTKVEIYNNKSQEKIFDFFGNDGRFFHQWLNKNGVEFLICAEDLFGGQTVIDLTNRRMESFSPDEDGFIWTNFHLSPDGKTLATIGCYWACPYLIKIYDFQEPLILPLTELNEIELLDADEIITGWLDNETLKMKGIKREKEMEKFQDGSFRMKTINETPIERKIKALKHNNVS